jgi:hypothetical protein
MCSDVFQSPTGVRLVLLATVGDEGQCPRRCNPMNVGCGFLALLLALFLGLGAFVAMPAEVSVEATAGAVLEVSPSP